MQKEEHTLGFCTVEAVSWFGTNLGGLLQNWGQILKWSPLESKFKWPLPQLVWERFPWRKAEKNVSFTSKIPTNMRKNE